MSSTLWATVPCPVLAPFSQHEHMFPLILLLFSYPGVMQDPCLFWQWKQNKKSHPEFSIPTGGASQEKQSFAVVFPFHTAEEQATFFSSEIQYRWRGWLWG